MQHNDTILHTSPAAFHAKACRWFFPLFVMFVVYHCVALMFVAVSSCSNVLLVCYCFLDALLFSFV